jgi:hypothetical protein
MDTTNKDYNDIVINHKDNLSEQEIIFEIIKILDNKLHESGLIDERYVEIYIILFLKYVYKLPNWKSRYSNIMTEYANDYQRDIFNRYLSKRIKTILEAL